MVSETGSGPTSSLGEGSAAFFGSSSSELSFPESDESNSDDDELGACVERRLGFHPAYNEKLSALSSIQT